MAILRGWLVLVALVVGLAVPVDAQRTAEAASAAAASSQPKRVVAAIASEPRGLNARAFPGSGAGLDPLEELLHVGLATTDGRGAVVLRLAEAIPTIENGLWRILPDGRMETTWILRSDALWHDGTPVTSADLLFTLRAFMDREVPLFPDPLYQGIESMAAPDRRYLTVYWRTPYIEADTLFTRLRGLPLPEHLLRQTYTERVEGFFDDPYWTDQFIGAGPYRLRQLVAGSHALLVANDRYVLGRPRIDEIQVYFIPDDNTIAANLLAGALDLTLGRTLSLQDAVEVRDRWRNGRLDVSLIGWLALYPQFIDPDPPVIANVDIRRALLHAIDRQEMVDSLMAGLIPVAHAFLSPAEPEYESIEESIVQYDFDPRRAIQLFETLGLARGANGLFQAGDGETLRVEIRTLPQSTSEAALNPVADYWNRIGVSVEAQTMPVQRALDREYRATFPGFELGAASNEVSALLNLHSSRIPQTESRFTGSNRARYASPQLDRIIDRYRTTITFSERMQALGQGVQHVTDLLPWMGLFHDGEPIFIADRVQNVTARANRATHSWNAHEWDAR